MYSILEEHEGGFLGKIINGVLIFFIISNVLVVIAESEKSFIHDYFDVLILFEYLSLGIFATEYVFRIWVATEKANPQYKTSLMQRLHYMMTPMALIDLLAIMPMLLGFFFSDNLLILRLTRLIRGFKITRYSHSMSLLMVVLKREAGTLFSTFFILGIIIVLAATGIYFVEGDVQPENFGSIPKALWWSTITLTTIGYGDVVPITVLGRLLGGVIAIVGITMAALPAGILASGFSAELNRRRDMYRYYVARLLDKGEIKLSEMRKLVQKQNELGISKSDAKVIMYELKQEVKVSTEVLCPYCSSKLHIAHPVGIIKIMK